MMFGLILRLLLACLLALLTGLVPPAGAEVQTFAGSVTCSECHAAESKAWSESDHAWALREPDLQSVLGDFSGATFTHKGVTSRFYTDAGRYMIETQGADGELAQFQVRYVVGVRPLQQYLIETGDGHIQAFDVAWDAVKRKWYHLYPNQDVSAGNGLHWTGSYQNWQARCASCHQTGFEKRYDFRTRAYKSHWAELTISCESCHGPRSEHVAAALLAKEGNVTYTPMPSPRMGPGRQAEELAVCGPCHSRREAFDAANAPVGSTFGDHYNLALLTPDLYFPDGQQKEEVYILGSFLQSKMMAKGVTCSNCHEPHAGKLVAEGNALCTQCHNQAGRADFPSLRRKAYDTPEHTHHKSGSEASQCVNCHMPERAYMIIDKRRDHFFRIPDPMQSKAAGSPDACMACHGDKTHEWAAATIASWPGAHDRSWQDRQAFIAFTLDPGSQDVAASLIAYLKDKERPAIMRATAAGLLRDTTFAAALSPDDRKTLLADTDALVRSRTAGMFRQTGAEEKLAMLSPLLTDPIRAVRQAAALELATVDRAALSVGDRLALDQALGEYRDSRIAGADTPEAHMALAGLALSLRDWPHAEQAFKTAVELDPQLEESWRMLARLRSALGDDEGASDYLSKGLERLPQSASLQLERAAFEVRHGRDAEAITWYQRVVAADERNLEGWLGLSSAALRQQNPALGLEAARRAIAIAGDSAEAHLLAAIAAYLTGDRDSARSAARRATELAPALVLPSELRALLNEN